MKIQSIIAILILSSLLISGCTSNPQQPMKHKTASIAETAICPVMGTEFPVAKAYDSIEYKGTTYHFCCAGCKPEFEKNPEKYIVNQHKQHEEMRHH